jgi:hypothetical protein
MLPNWYIENQKFVGLSLFVTNVWLGSYWLIEKCNIQDWFTFPSLVTEITIYLYAIGLLTGAYEHEQTD